MVPSSSTTRLASLLCEKVDVFLYPYLTVLLERRFYDVRNSPLKVPYSSIAKATASIDPTQNKMDQAPAIVVEHLTKRFPSSTLPRILRPWTWFGYLYRKIRGIHTPADVDGVVAIADLSFSVPRGGIFVLLGSNGAGKSTSLGIIAGLTDRSGGLVVFPEDDSTSSVVRDHTEKDDGSSEGSHRKLPKARGSLGIVPQKNVLFPELTCYETLRLWSAIKRPSGLISGQISVEKTKEDLEKLLVDCGLDTKIHSNAGNLSGGQKRKLQLAIGLVGGSESMSISVVIISFVFQNLRYLISRISGRMHLGRGSTLKKINMENFDVCKT